MAGPREQARRQDDIVQHHVGMQGGVAEQHVQQLAEIGVFGAIQDRRDRETDADLEEPVSDGGDGFDLADDVAEDGRLVDRLDRHFHALLDSDRGGTGLDRGGIIGSDAVAGGKAGWHVEARRNGRIGEL